jgi:predicted nucleic acid-binding protein
MTKPQSEAFCPNCGLIGELPVVPGLSQPDLIIAATAIHHGLTLVTRDRSDYDMAQVPIINPWDAV